MVTSAENCTTFESVVFEPKFNLFVVMEKSSSVLSYLIFIFSTILCTSNLKTL